MTFLCIFFISPLYFLLRKKWGGFIINSCFYGMACLFVLTIIFIWIAPIFWIIAVSHAGFYYRREMMIQHAELLATKMAEKLNPQPPTIR